MGTSNSYPFVTKREIIKKLQSGDRKTIAEFMAIMQQRHERRLAGDAGTGACGWMASQASTATKLAKKIGSGDANDADWTNAIRLLSRYVRQLASHYRAIEIEQHPALAEAARTFGLLGAPGVARTKKPRRVPGAWPPVPAEPEPEPPPASPEPTLPVDPAPTAPATLSLVERVLAAVRGVRGGMRREEIARGLSVSTVDVGAALHELLANKRVRKHGTGRGTRYVAR